MPAHAHAHAVLTEAVDGADVMVAEHGVRAPADQWLERELGRDR